MQGKTEPEKHRFRFSADEWDYLRRLSSEEPRIARLAGGSEPITPNPRTINLEPADIQELRGYLTERLARLGFDGKYDVNEEGRLLEQLIDRLFVP